MGEVDIQLTTANIPEDISYECCYGFQSGTSEQHSTTSTVTMVIPATRNNDMFTCRVRYDNVPKIPTNRGIFGGDTENNNFGNVNENVLFCKNVVLFIIRFTAELAFPALRGERCGSFRRSNQICQLLSTHQVRQCVYNYTYMCGGGMGGL